jgi:hypothetical protein
MSLYDVASLSSVPSLSTAVLSEVIEIAFFIHKCLLEGLLLPFLVTRESNINCS